MTKTHPPIGRHHMCGVGGTKSRYDDGCRWVVEPGEKLGLRRVEEVRQYYAPGELVGGDRLDRLATYLNEVGATGRRDRGACLCHGAGVEVNRKDVDRPSPRPRLRQEPRPATGVDGRSGGQLIEGSQAHRGGAMVRRPETVACHLHQLVHPERRGGVAVTSPIPPGDERSGAIRPHGDVAPGFGRKRA